MIKSLIRMISALFTPGLDMIARMPASAARQILFPLRTVATQPPPWRIVAPVSDG